MKQNKIVLKTTQGITDKVLFYKTFVLNKHLRIK